MAERRADVAVVGGGILGLAHAWHAARLGKKVVLFERSHQAQGASVRNYGLISVLAQPPGFLLQMAMRSRELWMELLSICKLPVVSEGSIHVCYADDEEAVGREFVSLAPAQGYTCQWLDAKRTLDRCDALRPDNLRGAVFSPTELTIDARLVMQQLPRVLAERFRIETRFCSPVVSIQLPKLRTASEEWQVDSAIICSGDDFESLYPQHFSDAGLARCKQQMMRTVRQPDGWKLGPALATAFAFRQYASFQMCTTLEGLKQRIARDNKAFDRWGLRLLITQSANGELTIGDSHEYGRNFDFFDRADIDELLLDRLDSFTSFPDRTIAQRWHGFYARHPDKPFIVATPEKGILIVTGVGGAGLTLSLGLAERVCKKFFE